jgi:putative heme-binding domain-containing protein
LFAVGDKFGRHEIIAAVLEPSASIAVGYSTTTIETRSGQIYTGIIKQVTDLSIELIGADGRSERLAAADILARQTSEVSLMPEGLEAGLTLEEFTALIEYLVSLKQPQSAAMVEHGMPSVIAQLARPMVLQPFIDADLSFEHPVWFGPLPGASNVFFVVEHETGKIWRLEKGLPGAVQEPTAGRPANAAALEKSRAQAPDISSASLEKRRPEACSKTLFLDTGVYDKGTRGLLGMVLHPKFRSNGKYYFAKQIMENGKFATFIFEREAAADLKTDSGKPSRRLFKFDEATNVHYGGGLAFGPDDYLYIGMGDSGPQGDPQGHGQDAKLFLGKMLRIDVDHADADKPYAIPPDNPFRTRPDLLPEIWALGFREPWRFSFDPVAKDLWVGDVGQDRYEEVDVVRRGENYGWNVYEGFERFSNRYRRDGETYVAPVFAYGRRYGPSVTGGFVYRANPRSTFYGVYIFGDYESRRVFGLTQQDRVLKVVRQIGTAPQRIVSFGQDNQRALYLVGYEGMIYKIDCDRAVFE